MKAFLAILLCLPLISAGFDYCSASVKCPANSYCNGYNECQCNSGYYNKGHACIEKAYNYCEYNSDCAFMGHCKMLVHECACDHGYSGDGKDCTYTDTFDDSYNYNYSLIISICTIIPVSLLCAILALMRRRRHQVLVGGTVLGNQQRQYQTVLPVNQGPPAYITGPIMPPNPQENQGPPAYITGPIMPPNPQENQSPPPYSQAIQYPISVQQQQEMPNLAQTEQNPKNPGVTNPNF